MPQASMGYLRLLWGAPYFCRYLKPLRDTPKFFGYSMLLWVPQTSVGYPKLLWGFHRLLPQTSVRYPKILWGTSNFSGGTTYLCGVSPTSVGHPKLLWGTSSCFLGYPKPLRYLNSLWGTPSFGVPQNSVGYPQTPLGYPSAGEP